MVSAKSYVDSSDNDEEVTSGSEDEPSDAASDISESIVSEDGIDINFENCETQNCVEIKSKKKNKKRKRCSDLSLSFNEDATNDRSLDLSVNVTSVGSVLKNKKNEYLPCEKQRVKKHACLYCLKKQ